jgi:hypothetical protein
VFLLFAILIGVAKALLSWRLNILKENNIGSGKENPLQVRLNRRISDKFYFKIRK